MNPKFKYVQLDLARQMETLSFIREFIDLIQSVGYNGLLLYLEDRVKTASYPYAAANESYSGEEIRQLAKYAESKNIELIPCIATLGHAERFLSHSQMRKFAEVREGMTGRFGNTNALTFCPSAPGFYEWMEQYLTEVASLFPSAFFHAGLDEFWDFVICPDCKKAAPDRDGEMKLFLQHIEKIRTILAKSGKRMMLWSDMFEFYPALLSKLPKDLIVCDWQYQADVRFYLQHFCDGTVENRLAVNCKLGLDTFISPCDMGLSNSDSYLDYAKNLDVCGFLFTTWEKTDAFLYRSLPAIVNASYRMQNISQEEAFAMTMERLFNTRSPILTEAVRSTITPTFWRHFRSVSKNELFTRNFFGIKYHQLADDRFRRAVLAEFSDRMETETACRILNDLIATLDERIISHRLKALYHAVFDGRPGEWEKVEALHGEFIALMEKMRDRYEQYRPGIGYNIFKESLGKLRKQLVDQLAMLKQGKFLKIRGVLPDGYGVERVDFELIVRGKEVKVNGGVFKPTELDEALFERFVALPLEVELAEIEFITVTASGMGGIGIAYIELPNKKTRSISGLDGEVSHPENLLDNDLKFSWFGGQSTRHDYFNAVSATVRHSVQLQLENIEKLKKDK